MQTEELAMRQAAVAQEQADRQAAQAERQQAIADAQRGQAAMVALAQDQAPSWDKVAAAMEANPAMAMELREWYQGQAPDARKVIMDDTAKLAYALGSGNLDLARQMLAAEAAAAEAGGDKAGADQANAMAAMLDVDSGAEAVKSHLLGTIHTIATPEELAAIGGQLFPVADIGTAKTAAEIAKLDAEAAKLKAETDALANKPAASQTEIADLAERWNKTYYSRSGNYRDASMAYSNITEAGKAGSGAGDVALITSFMKMLDPGSVVRETEFATARDTNGLYESLQSSLSKAQTGELLTPAARQNYLDLANKYMAAANKRDETIRADIRPSIAAIGIPEELVFGVSAQGTPIVATSTPPATVTPPGANPLALDPALLKYLETD
jgi:hypothetical protein